MGAAVTEWTAKDATASGFQTAKDVMAPAAAAVEPAWDVMAPAIAPAASTVWNATKEGTRRSLDATRKGLDATRVAGGAVAGQLEPVLTATREADLSRKDADGRPTSTILPLFALFWTSGLKTEKRG